jgi:DNA-binding MarR family transcriptional regulator
LNTPGVTDHEFAILESIYHTPEENPVRQRDLARIVGISLGMTNVILKKLAQKGWVVIRKINNRNIQYIVTHSGIEEIAHRSYRFLKKTLRNVVYYKGVLETFLIGVKAKGCHGILLVGKSDFDFILAHLCQKHKLDFHQSEEPRKKGELLLVYSEDIENFPAKSAETRGERAAFLHDMLIGL